MLLPPGGRCGPRKVYVDSAGARIRKDSVVGAGSVITEGKEYSDRSLIVGAPARVVRALSDEQIKGLMRGAPQYVNNGRRFKAGLKEIG